MRPLLRGMGRDVRTVGRLLRNSDGEMTIKRGLMFRQRWKNHEVFQEKLGLN